MCITDLSTPDDQRSRGPLGGQPPPSASPDLIERGARPPTWRYRPRALIAASVSQNPAFAQSLVPPDCSESGEVPRNHNQGGKAFVVSPPAAPRCAQKRGFCEKMTAVCAPWAARCVSTSRPIVAPAGAGLRLPRSCLASVPRRPPSKPRRWSPLPLGFVWGPPLRARPRGRKRLRLAWVPFAAPRPCALLGLSGRVRLRRGVGGAWGGGKPQKREGG